MTAIATILYLVLTLMFSRIIKLFFRTYESAHELVGDNDNDIGIVVSIWCGFLSIPLLYYLCIKIVNM